jgi:hypothetical protein
MESSSSSVLPPPSSTSAVAALTEDHLEGFRNYQPTSQDSGSNVWVIVLAICLGSYLIILPLLISLKRICGNLRQEQQEQRRRQPSPKNKEQPQESIDRYTHISTPIHGRRRHTSTSTRNGFLVMESDDEDEDDLEFQRELLKQASLLTAASSQQKQPSVFTRLMSPVFPQLEEEEVSVAYHSAGTTAAATMTANNTYTPAMELELDDYIASAHEEAVSGRRQCPLLSSILEHTSSSMTALAGPSCLVVVHGQHQRRVLDQLIQAESQKAPKDQDCLQLASKDDSSEEESDMIGRRQSKQDDPAMPIMHHHNGKQELRNHGSLLDDSGRDGFSSSPSTIPESDDDDNLEACHVSLGKILKWDLESQQLVQLTMRYTTPALVESILQIFLLAILGIWIGTDDLAAYVIVNRLVGGSLDCLYKGLLGSLQQLTINHHNHQNHGSAQNNADHHPTNASAPATTDQMVGRYVQIVLILLLACSIPIWIVWMVSIEPVFQWFGLNDATTAVGSDYTYLVLVLALIHALRNTIHHVLGMVDRTRYKTIMMLGEQGISVLIIGIWSWTGKTDLITVGLVEVELAVTFLVWHAGIVAYKGWLHNYHQGLLGSWAITVRVPLVVQ